MSHRLEKINQLLRTLLAEIVQKDLSLKTGVMVSVLKVDTSRDLRYSNVFLSVFPAQEKGYVVNTLQKEIVRIQKIISQKTSLKNTPRLRFLADDTQEKAAEIEAILSRIKKEQP